MKTTLLSLLPFLMMASTTSAGVTAAQVINEGGLRIFRAIGQKNEGNICLSPYSIQAALAMTYAGAQGSTMSQMAEALGFPKNPADLADGFQKLDAALIASRERGGKDTSLHVANRLFGAAGFSFRPAFLELLKLQFSAPLEELDFQKNPSAAADLINGWVEKQTEKRIQNLIPADALDKTTTLVLVNALYLKIPWGEEFSAGGTKDLPFLVSGRDKANVPTMARTDSFGYSELPGFQAVGIPFRGGQFQFLILLPAKPGSADLPSSDLLEKCASLPRQDVSLFLPKFKLEPPTISLAKTLQSLGIQAAFDLPRGSADFDGMAPRKPDDYLYLSDVFHKTFFALDEKGVEAAAATAVVMMRATSMPVQSNPIEVRVDRPFFFAIQHIPTSACLFLGKITDPR
jgi:serine protease inhibitor